MVYGVYADNIGIDEIDLFFGGWARIGFSIDPAIKRNKRCTKFGGEGFLTPFGGE